MPDRRAHLARINQDIIACARCTRLREHCEEVAQTKRRAYKAWTYWGRPVCGFGDPDAQIYILGLAPGAHGANRTGRMFTGDDSGAWLYRALHEVGLANQPDAHHRDDGLELHDVFIGAVGRCAPPQNKLVAGEIANCAEFWQRELRALTGVRVIVPLGGVAFDQLARWMAVLGLLPRKVSRGAFAHGAELIVPAAVDAPAETPTCLAGGVRIVCSYHPSRQNTQTGRLSREMLRSVFARARELVTAA